MSEGPAVLVNFDFLDAVELDEADNLILELSDIDVEAQVAEERTPGVRAGRKLSRFVG